MYKGRIVSTWFGVFCLASFTMLDGRSWAAEAAGAAPAAAQVPEPWAKLPPNQWPQLVLTNEASFQGHTALDGASAFLMRMPDQEVLVGTAKHLTREAGGVNPPIPMADFDSVLQSWKVYPRTKAQLAIAAKGLAITINREKSHDWLLLHLADPKAKLPSTPLTPRTKPVGVGEIVYLIGVPYSDRGSAQNVYKGMVTARPSKHYFTYEFTPPVHISGFSGAPIVDAHGLLVGHGVSRSKLKQQDGMEVEFGGEDADLALELWRHRSDPPAAQVAATVHLALPAGWIEKTPSNAAKQFAESRSPLAAVELLVVPKVNFEDDYDLGAWARTTKAIADKNGTLQDRQETELHPGRVAGHETIEYEMTGKVPHGTLRYRVVMLEYKGCFCKIPCWTTPPNWDAAQAKFEEAIASLK